MREQPLALSPMQELAVGRRAYQEVLDEFHGKLLPSHHPQVQRARRVSQRLIKAASLELLQREIYLRVRGYRFEWETNILHDPKINAFCLPTGKMFLFTGILKVIGDNDDFLATVLSHEMAHALAHHASERVAREQGGKNILRTLSYNRMQESEADHIGVFLMAFAGYDPDLAVEFWKHMQQALGQRDAKPEFLSDHPSPEHRIRDLRQWAPMARKAKEAFEAGRVAR